jgi:TonB family protein
MKKVVLLFLICITVAVSDQRAVTIDSIEVILNEDSTWHTADPISVVTLPFARTDDSQTVYLKDDGRWKYIDLSDTVDTAVLEALDTLGTLEDYHDKPIVEIIPFHMLDKKPELLSRPRLDMPPEAVAVGAGGKVRVKGLIDIDGTVMKVEILKSSGNEYLDRTAKAHLKQCRFTPAEYRGYKVRAWIVMPFDFKSH